MAFVVLEDFPGSETRVQRQAGALVEAGHDVRVFAASGPSEEVEWNGVKIERSRLRRVKVGSRLRRLVEYSVFCLDAFGWCWGTSRRWAPDVVQVANMPDWLVFSALPARWFAGSRIVLDLHDPMPELWAAKKGRAGVRSIIEWLEGLSIMAADRCLVATGPMARAIEARHPAASCVVVMNAVDEARFPYREPRVRQASGLVVGYHGTLASRFGVSVLLGAFARLLADGEPARLVIVGDGDEQAALKKRAAALGIEASVGFLGQRPADTLSELIADFDVGTVPYVDSEFMRLAYSTKSFEYAISGVAMLVADIEPMRDLFQSDEVTFVPPGDEDAWLTALRFARDEPELMNERAIRAGQRVGEYSWMRLRGAYVHLIETCASGRRGRT